MPESIDTLGTILDETAGRDAVHISILPAIAESFLVPGEKVGYNNGYANNSGTCKKIGIVDPYGKNIEIGQRFWIFLFPRKVTSLRHVWVHPDVPNEDPNEQLQFANQEIDRLKKNLGVFESDPGFRKLADYVQDTHKEVEELVDLNCLQCYGY